MWKPSRIKLIAAGVLLAPLLGVSLYTCGSLNVSFSNGERAGYLQKISRKGWVCKTWEGELAMVSLPGTTPEIFKFSVRDDAVAKRVNEVTGKKVALTYEQHKGVPTQCFGETEYFVTAVRAVE